MKVRTRKETEEGKEGGGGGEELRRKEKQRNKYDTNADTERIEEVREKERWIWRKETIMKGERKDENKQRSNGKMGDR